MFGEMLADEEIVALREENARLQRKVEELEREAALRDIDCGCNARVVEQRKRAEAAEAKVDRLTRMENIMSGELRDRTLEVERLTALLDVSERKLGEWRDRGSELERLRAALVRVADGPHGDDPAEAANAMIAAARAALAPKVKP